VIRPWLLIARENECSGKVGDAFHLEDAGAPAAERVAGDDMPRLSAQADRAAALEVTEPPHLGSSGYRMLWSRLHFN
jgi:hypothetical protein